MPTRRSKDFLDTEVEDQGGKIPAADPTAFLGDQRLPILPPPTNGNPNYKPAPWLTPSRLREDFPDK